MPLEFSIPIFKQAVNPIFSWLIRVIRGSSILLTTLVTSLSFPSLTMINSKLLYDWFKMLFIEDERVPSSRCTPMIIETKGLFSDIYIHPIEGKGLNLKSILCCFKLGILSSMVAKDNNLNHVDHESLSPISYFISLQLL